MIIDNGWLTDAIIIPSPNFDERPEQSDIDLIVIHNISLPPEQFGGAYIDDLFTNKLDPKIHPYFIDIYQRKLSSHLLIERTGVVKQFVDFNQRAWHAGQSSYQGRNNCNDFSIGIELEGSDSQDFTEQQYQQLHHVLDALIGEYPNLNRERIVGHSDIAPGRKTDPGPHFDWGKVREV